MRDPYEILGVPRNASNEQIKAAYRSLAKKYHPDNYENSPLADAATKKMQEINEAYDSIMSGNASSDSYSNYNNYSNYNSYTGNSNSGGRYANDYSYIRSCISLKRLDEAEMLLENITPDRRDAEWYFLKGQVNYSRGWIDQASTYFTTAHNMDPSNAEYLGAYNTVKNQRSGGFRTSRGRASSPDVCTICQGLLCADCCCECMGGDLIPCC